MVMWRICVILHLFRIIQFHERVGAPTSEWPGTPATNDAELFSIQAAVHLICTAAKKDAVFFACLVVISRQCLNIKKGCFCPGAVIYIVLSCIHAELFAFYAVE